MRRLILLAIAFSFALIGLTMVSDSSNSVLAATEPNENASCLAQVFTPIAGTDEQPARWGRMPRFVNAMGGHFGDRVSKIARGYEPIQFGPDPVPLINCEIPLAQSPPPFPTGPNPGRYVFP